jgi:hypothetical protein
MFIKHLKNKVMDNKKIIIIGGTSIIVIGLLYFAFKKASQNDDSKDAQIKADFDNLIKKIDNAKK